MDWFKAVGGGTLDRKSLAAWMVRALVLTLALTLTLTLTLKPEPEA